MKITRTAEKINLNLVMDVPVDVHKDMLNLYCSEDGKQYSDECRNHTKTINKKLKEFHEIALAHGKPFASSVNPRVSTTTSCCVLPVSWDISPTSYKVKV